MGRKCASNSTKRRLGVNVSIRADLVDAITMLSNVQSLPRSVLVEQAVYEYLVSRRVIERSEEYAERYQA